MQPITIQFAVRVRNEYTEAPYMFIWAMFGWSFMSNVLHNTLTARKQQAQQPRVYKKTLCDYLRILFKRNVESQTHIGDGSANSCRRDNL